MTRDVPVYSLTPTVQFTTTVMGATFAPPAAFAIRNRCPSGATLHAFRAPTKASVVPTDLSFWCSDLEPLESASIGRGDRHGHHLAGQRQIE